MTYDLIILGSGAAGMAAAVVAAQRGKRVLVLEKEAVLGGTTAWSGGWLWVPHNALAVKAGLVEHPSGPQMYVQHELGADLDPERMHAYLKNAPRMVDFFRMNTDVQWVDGNAIPDFHGHTPHAAKGGRSVCAAPFDGRELEGHIALLRRPLDMGTLWGMGIAAGADLRHFLQVTRSLTSFIYVAKRLLKHAWDMTTRQRSMQLVAGNALAGRLLLSALKAKVEFRTHTSVQRLLQDDAGRVTGVAVTTAKGEESIHNRCGVVLACGGCPHDDARLQQWLPYGHALKQQFGRPHFSAAPASNTGDGLKLAEAVGAALHMHAKGTRRMAHAPVSLAKRSDGTVCHFPHLVERGKPGLIAVTQTGQRFVNEADSYNDFMQALFAATPAGAAPVAWLVCDHAFIRRYGLGAVKPMPAPLPTFFSIGSWRKRGYLKRGRTVAELAQACGIDALALQNTVNGYNRFAVQGLDPAFNRGHTPYNRMQGDAARSDNNGELPNPCVAPLLKAPFYAVQVLPGSLGSFGGIKTNAHAQVLNAQDQPIAGLYAAGNDAASVMGGHYPSGGITLAPAMTFAYIAARHATDAR